MLRLTEPGFELSTWLSRSLGYPSLPLRSCFAALQGPHTKLGLTQLEGLKVGPDEKKKKKKKKEPTNSVNLEKRLFPGLVLSVSPRNSSAGLGWHSSEKRMTRGCNTHTHTHIGVHCHTSQARGVVGREREVW